MLCLLPLLHVGGQSIWSASCVSSVEAREVHLPPTARENAPIPTVGLASKTSYL